MKLKTMIQAAGLALTLGRRGPGPDFRTAS